jgi:hypothetical protein
VLEPVREISGCLVNRDSGIFLWLRLEWEMKLVYGFTYTSGSYNNSIRP